MLQRLELDGAHSLRCTPAAGGYLSSYTGKEFEMWTFNKIMFGLVVVSVLGTGIFAHANLIHHWKLNEGEGTTTADAVGSEDGTLGNDVSWETSNLPPFTLGYTTTSAAKFAGGSNDSDNSITMAGYKGITGTQARTVALWINSTATGQSSHATLVSWGREGTSTGDDGARFDLRLDDGQLRLEVQGGFIVGTTNLNDGEWHHVAVTWASGGAEDATLYVNGVSEAITSTNSQTIDTGSEGDFRLGSSVLDNSDNSRRFEGLMDDVRLYDSALTSSEIVALVPEPGSVVLLGIGAALVLMLRRRRHLG